MNLATLTVTHATHEPKCILLDISATVKGAPLEGVNSGDDQLPSSVAGEMLPVRMGS